MEGFLCIFSLIFENKIKLGLSCAFCSEYIRAEEHVVVICSFIYYASMTLEPLFLYQCYTVFLYNNYNNYIINNKSDKSKF
jgi:hypothetical protein